jgi:two-component system, LuxR family, response regulator FixJ
VGLYAEMNELSKNKGQLFLVEDDPSVSRALNRLLKASGFEVKRFARPSELLEAGVPDSTGCLIFDVHLPEMTGPELYQVLINLGCRSPLILITAHLDKTTRELANDSGAAAFLIKPFSRDSLLAAISKALNPAAGSA